MNLTASLGVPRLPLADWIDSAVQWLLDNVPGLFGVISSVIGAINGVISSWLAALPVGLLMALLVVLAWELSGVAAGLFTLAALGIIANLGLWSPMTETLALTITAAAIALAIAEPLGVAAGLSKRVESVLRPVLDFMQTMPAFVYLIPAVMFFSLGPVPAVVSTVVFAIPPPVRLTTLGIKQVPRQMAEVGEAFGATRWQMLRKIQLPLALPSMLAGVNQCIMMSLSMVIIASMIGAKGLGERILYAISQVQVGTGFVAGLAVVFAAIILDRITAGAGNRSMRRRPPPFVQAPLSGLVRLALGRHRHRTWRHADRTSTRTVDSHIDEKVPGTREEDHEKHPISPV